MHYFLLLNRMDDTMIREKKQANTHMHARTLFRHTLARKLKRFSNSDIWIDDTFNTSTYRFPDFLQPMSVFLCWTILLKLSCIMMSESTSPFRSIRYLRSLIFPKIVPYISHITIEYLSPKLIQIITFLELSSTLQPSTFNR